jgi:CPA1 family monovalent cation:H+ antiporter
MRYHHDREQYLPLSVLEREWYNQKTMQGGGSVLELLSGLIVLLLIAAGVKAFTNRTRLPFSVVLVFLGILLSFISKRFSHVLPPFHEYEISSEMILFLFLPTLIYESAQGLDVRELRKNLVPVLTLAVPGLVLSTAVIGIIVNLLTPLSLPVSLLLGAILSATDPVAVISLFKRVGAPKRLLVLIEGESLFNDATSIVLSRILVAVAAGGGVAFASFEKGVPGFFLVFLGGIAVGAVFGFIAGFILGKVRSESLIVITVTTVLAYLSFIVAEEFFHVSGAPWPWRLC